MEDIEAAQDLNVLGTYKDKNLQGFTYSLWLDQPPGWAGGPSGNFVLTEDAKPVGSGGGGGTKELSGRWELKEKEKLHLIPQTVEEAFWDDEMGEGEWETRYRYEGDSPLVATAEDIVDDIKTGNANHDESDENSRGGIDVCGDIIGVSRQRQGVFTPGYFFQVAGKENAGDDGNRHDGDTRFC